MQVVFKVLSFVGNPVAEVPGIARGILKIVQHTSARAEMTNMPRYWKKQFFLFQTRFDRRWQQQRGFFLQGYPQSMRLWSRLETLKI